MDEDIIPMDKLARIYRKIKTEIDTLTKDYDTKVEMLKEKQDTLKFAMKDQMKALGVKSVQTEFGTVSMINKTRYSTQDWDSFKKFIIEHEVVDLLEKRIALRVFTAEAMGFVDDDVFEVSNAFLDRLVEFAQRDEFCA